MTEKQKESLNKFLTEKFFGECRHESFWEAPDDRICRICKIRNPPINPDYTTESGFWVLWNKAKESEEWDTFMRLRGNGIVIKAQTTIGVNRPMISVDLINPPVFAEAWARFLGWKGEG